MLVFGYFSKDVFGSKNTKEYNFLSIATKNGGTNICINISEIRVPPPSEFLIFEHMGAKD